METEEMKTVTPFDRRVHIRDPKTGRIKSVQPYREHMTKQRQSVLERNGEFFWENGEHCPPEVVYEVLGKRAPAYILEAVKKVEAESEVSKAKRFEAEKDAALKAHLSQKMAEQGYDKVQAKTEKDKTKYFTS